MSLFGTIVRGGLLTFVLLDKQRRRRGPCFVAADSALNKESLLV